MFRLPPTFRRTCEEAYSKRPIRSANGKAYKCSINKLSESIQVFIETELNDAKLDIELFGIYTSRGRYKGYQKHTLYRFFDHDINWEPSRDLVDLLCWYAFGRSYENAVKDSLVEDKIEEFQYLKSHRASQFKMYSSALKSRVSNSLVNKHKKRISLELKDPNNSIVFEKFDTHDIKRLQRFDPLRRTLGHISWDLIADRVKKNGEVIRGYKIVTPLDEIILGFFIVYPLTKLGGTLINKGVLKQSDDFKLRHINKDFKTAFALYISIVYAASEEACPFISLKLNEELFKILEESSSIDTVYTRPITDDGDRNVKRYNFRPLEIAPALYYKTRPFETDRIK